MRPDPAVMLFTAGFGTRMAPLTDRVPKPLIPVAGRPLAQHALDLVRAAGLKRIVANTHHLAGQMSAFLRTHRVAEIHEPEILETGGGLKNALPLLGRGPVITVNSDAVWSGPNPVSALLRAWRPERMDALLAVVPLWNAIGHAGAGDFSLTEEGRLRRAGPYVYSGVQILKTERLADIHKAKFSLNVLWDMFAAQDRLYGLPHAGLWCDVGRPESIALAEEMLRQKDV